MTMPATTKTTISSCTQNQKGDTSAPPRYSLRRRLICAMPRSTRRAKRFEAST